MKPSKMRKKMSKTKADLSRTHPNSPESVIVDVEEIKETDDDGRRGLDWLISAFPRLSLEQIDSAYEEAGGDTFKAAGILGAELVDPEECPGSVGKKSSARKHRRIAASTGMVSGIIGKEYSKPALGCSGGRRGWGGPMEVNKRAVCALSSEEAENFLCSMLGGDSELGMGVVMDVLGQCGYNLEMTRPKPFFSRTWALLPLRHAREASSFFLGRRHMEAPATQRRRQWKRLTTARARAYATSPSSLSVVDARLGDDVSVFPSSFLRRRRSRGSRKALDSLLDISKLSNNQFKERVVNDHIEVVSGEIHREMLSKDPSRDEQTSFQLTDKPSVSTFHSSAKEQDILQFVGSDCREYLKVPLNTKEEVSSRSPMVHPDLQQKVLESLFNVPEMSRVVNSMSWKKVVKQVESFGQGLGLSVEGTAEPSSESSGVGKEDDYHDFRSMAKKNWDTMRSYYNKAALTYSRGERAQASYLSEKGKFYKKLALEADEKASKEIFEARNKAIKNTVTIDLHGQHVKQAIRLLKLHLLLFAYIPSVHFLRVITGCGANGVGLGKLKRTVLELAQKEGIKCNLENSGTLLLCLEGQRPFSFMESEIDSDENKP